MSDNRIADREDKQWAVYLPGRGYVTSEGFDIAVTQNPKEARVFDNPDDAVAELDRAFAAYRRLMGPHDEVIGRVMQRTVSTYIGDWGEVLL